MLNQYPRSFCAWSARLASAGPCGYIVQQKHHRMTAEVVGFGLPLSPMLIPSPWGAPSGQLPFGFYPAKDIPHFHTCARIPCCAFSPACYACLLFDAMGAAQST